MSKRFVVECVWNGYTSSQRRVCHRTVETYKAKSIEKIHTVAFTDNTTMNVTVRPCKLREQVKEMDCYGTLLNDFVKRNMSGFCKVSDILER